MDSVVTGARDRHAQPPAVTVVLAGVCLCAALAVAVLQLRHEPRTLDRRAVAPVLLSDVQLERFASGAGQPVYWAGPRSGYVYELTLTPSGRVYVRYLPQGYIAGDTRPDFLTVATYPTSGAYDNLRRTATRPGASATSVAGGGLAVTWRHSATNVYLAYPRANYQVEVFDPVPGHARSLLLNGAIAPLG